MRETIGNYLKNFITPEVAEVFCATESTFDFSTIDQGKIILTTMPQKFQTERRYVNTFLKLLLLFYNHALRRFDKAKAERAQDNLIILWADEAQRFMGYVGGSVYSPCRGRTGLRRATPRAGLTQHTALNEEVGQSGEFHG